MTFSSFRNDAIDVAEKSERGFCTKCGTTMFYRSSVAPGEVHVALACLDDANIETPEQVHIFFDARAVVRR